MTGKVRGGTPLFVILDEATTLIDSRCETTTKIQRSGFRCTLPAGHEHGHYFIAADVADGRHDDPAVDQ